MHFHMPKPLHGWREFAGEVGIIVIGVLIALGAEQVVETVHGNAEVRAFRRVAPTATAEALAMPLPVHERSITLGPPRGSRHGQL